MCRTPTLDYPNIWRASIALPPWPGPARPPNGQPAPHPSGACPPKFALGELPAHVAIVMDGNGRWAKQRGLARTKGHEAGEAVLLEVIEGAIELGIKTVYAFSTENWKRYPTRSDS